MFLGVGEKIDALQPFDPERMASRILGMGDVVSLVEEVQRKVDVGQAEKLARKVASGKGFNLLDLREPARAGAQARRHGRGAWTNCPAQLRRGARHDGRCRPTASCGGRSPSSIR